MCYTWTINKKQDFCRYFLAVTWISQLRRFIFSPSPNSFVVFVWLSSFFFFLLLNRYLKSLFPGKTLISLQKMVDSGKEFLVLDSYNNIPWLIWIQMLVFVLLLLLLCVIGIFSFDIVDNSYSSSDSVPSTSGSSLSKRFLSGNPIPISHHGLGFSVNSSLVQSHQVTLILSVSFNFVDESWI